MKLKFENSNSHKMFQEDINKEIRKGEIARSRLLSGILLSLSIIFILAPTFMFESYVAMFTERLNPVVPPFFFFLVSSYFFLRSILFQRDVRTFRKDSNFSKYFHAIIETSLPSCVLFYLGSIREPAIYVMLTPPIFVYFLFIIISALQLNFKICVFTGFVAAIEYLSLAIFFSNKSKGFPVEYLITSIPSHIAKSFLMAISGIIVGVVTLQIEKRLLNSFSLLEERNRVTSIFGQHVSPAVVEKLLSQYEFTSETKHVCMLFFDIRDFTSFSENRMPEEVVNYLNTIFNFAIEIINENGGIINKFLGDGFMAVFGAPISGGQDVKNAVDSSLAIIERVELEVANGNIPQTKIGIGLHSGNAVTGNVGSSLRKEYTIIGDVVNLASRIEQLNKKYSSKLLVSEDVWNSISGYDGESLGDVIVKGREQAVKIYKLA